jgi:signal transduction histidine kinase
MRFARAALAVPVVIAGLTWLSFRAFDGGAEGVDRALNALDRLEKVQSSLHRDVLAARAGLLRNYDPLVQEMRASCGLLAPLRRAAPADGSMRDAVDHLATSIRREESLIEAFKSDNALLQNSLAYFGLFAGQLVRGGPEGSLAPTVGALSLSMLRLTLDTSPANVSEVAGRLDALAAQTPLPVQSDATRALLAHGRLLQRLLPETDGVLVRLSFVPGEQALASVRASLEARQLALRASDRLSRLGLYIVSVLLVGLLVYAGQRLRRWALALRRRARLEHVMARISTGLINVGPEAIDTAIDRALGELAACIGADRAYVLFRGMSDASRTWHRDGNGFPSGWPDGAWTLLARLAPTPEGLVYVADADRLSRCETKELLRAAQVRSFACVSRADGDRAGIMLGFDASHRRIVNSFGELGLLRVALDAIATAVGRLALEQDRARLEQDLQQARRMETVGALATGVAHNFNNILGAMLGYTEMAEARLGADPAALRDLGEIRQAGERGRDLVDQILTFGRRRDACPGCRVCLPRLLDETASLLRATLPARVTLVVHKTPDAAVVADPAQLQQVILNLCNNAAQATEGAGAIELSTDLLVLAASQSLSHGDLAPGRYARIAVSDAGHGMDAATLARIFEPFFTTRPTGNGLGLATVREIVRESGGAMDVASVPGLGSRFAAWLPLAEDANAREGCHELPLGNGETVLVVDDEPEQLVRHEEIVAALGYEPVGFVDPAEAASACRAAPDRFDALLVGRVRSAAGPLGLAASLATLAPGVPILLAQASAGMARADALAAARIAEVVHRPFVSAEIAAALRRCLGPPAGWGAALPLKHDFAAVQQERSSGPS